MVNRTTKKTLWHIFMDGVQLPHGQQSHFEEAAYFFPLSFQKFLVLILLTSERGKTESTVEPLSDSVKGKVAWKVVKLKNPITFQVIETSTGFYLTFLKLNLIVHIKTMWFITFSTKHPICKTSLLLNRCLIKVDKKIAGLPQ